MATAEEYASWIVANRDKQGTPEFETVAEAYRQARGASGENKADAGPQDPTQGFRTTLQFGPIDTGVTLPESLSVGLAGAGKRLSDIFSLGLREQQPADEALMRRPAAMAGGIGADLASMVGGGTVLRGMSAVPRVGSVLARMGSALSTPKTAAQAIAAPAAYAAATAPGGAIERGKEAIAGGIGGGIGYGVGSILGRTVRPVQSTPSPQVADLARKAQAMGISLDASQVSDSKVLRWLSSALDNMPFTADKQAAFKQLQREAWQRGVLLEVGEQATNATTDVMGRAKDRLGKVFSDISARNQVVLDKPLRTELSAVKAANAEAGPLASGKVDDVVEWLTDLMQPKTTSSKVLGPSGAPFTSTTPAQPMSGEQYQRIRSILTREAQSAFSGNNSQLGQSLKALRNALDDAADRSISAADAQAWRTARDQWKSLKAIEKATDPTTGVISPKKLVNELTRKNPQGMIYGKGSQSMADKARVGKQFIAENLPDSGTAQRQFYMNLMSGAGGGLGLGALAGVVPPAAVLGAAATATTPLAVQRAMTSPGGVRYLTKGIAPGSNQAVIDALKRYSTLGGAGLLGNLY